MLRGPRAVQWRRLLELMLIVGGALFALGFHLTLPARLPAEDDWRALGARLESQVQPGDAVVLHPWWTDDARRFLPEALPIHGDPHAAGRDLVEASRIWVISQPRLPRADTRGFERAFLPLREPLDETTRFGPLELRAYRNLRHRPVAFDAAASLARAQAWIETPGAAKRACRRVRDDLECPGLGRLRSGLHEVDFAPIRCLPLPPPGGASRLVVEFRDVPRAGQLLFEGGVIGEEAWKKGPELTPLGLGVESPDRVLLERSLPAGSEGLTQAVLDELAGTPRTLRLVSRAERPGRRVPCVNLRVLGPADGGAR